MKVFELRAILSRLEPDTEIFVTSTVTKGHGSFTTPVISVFQDRTSRMGGEERPVLVINHDQTSRVWVAKSHGRPEVRKVTANVMYFGGDPGRLHYRGALPEGEERFPKLLKMWDTCDITVHGSQHDGWKPLEFLDKDEANEFAERILGLTIIDLHPVEPKKS